MTHEPQITGYRLMRREKTKQLIAEMLAKKANKYGAKRIEVDGEWFDSKREAELYHQFKMLERAGQITDLQRQPRFILAVNDVEITKYKADFEYTEKGQRHVIDVKSEATAKRRDFHLVRRLMRACHGIEVEVLL
jgi:hypothetical protein